MGVRTHGQVTVRRRRVALLAAAVSAVIVICPAEAPGQRATEQFIPIGQSPGLSGTVTYTGEIAELDRGARTISMRRPGDAAMVSVTVARRTLIWLDRSSVGLTNLAGTFADLVPGRVVEIHLLDPEDQGIADWIKIASDRTD